MAVKALETTGMRWAVIPSVPRLPGSAETPGVAYAGHVALARAAGGRALERLLIFVPALILPTVGTLPDLALLALIYATLLAHDAARYLPAGTDRRQAACLLAGTAIPLVTAVLLAPGIALPLALLAAICRLEDRFPLPQRLLLGALGGALVVDLALVAAGMERGGLWLTLGAAIALAFAAGRELAALPRTAEPAPAKRMAGVDRRLPALEVVLVTALILVLAFYGALLAGEPMLRALAGSGGHLTIPLLAAAVWCLTDRALARPLAAGRDPLAVGLVALWALAATLLH